MGDRQVSLQNTHHTSVDRFYREAVSLQDGEVSFQAAVGESDLWVTAREDLSGPIADHLHIIRGQIQAFAVMHPEFLRSLVPLGVPGAAPEIVRAMAEAGQACGVGPMASVAGAVAQSVADAFCRQSPDVLVENGGDVYLHSTRDRTVALLAEPESGAKIGLSISADEFPVALCSSSGKVGHSLSLGKGDLVTVRSGSGPLADAAATALANIIQEDKDVGRVVELAQQWEAHGIDGVFAQCGKKIAAWGKMELVAL